MASLSAALASARPGDTVTVPVGVHRGPFRVPVGVTLVAEAPGATLLGPIVLRSGTLDGLTLKGDGPAAAARPSTACSPRRPQSPRASSLVPASPRLAPALVDIPSGSSTLVGCRIDGTVRVGPGCTVQIQRSHISCAAGAGIELNGTADGCEVSENTIEARASLNPNLKPDPNPEPNPDPDSNPDPDPNRSPNTIEARGGAGIVVRQRQLANP